MANPNISQIGSFLTPRGASGDNFTSGAGHDNVAVTFPSCDRLDYESATVLIAGIVNVSATFFLKDTIQLQDSADNSNWNTAVTLKAAANLVAGAFNGGFQDRFDLNLAQYNRYVRLVLTLQLTKGSIDTVAYGACFILGGAVQKPAAAS